MGCHRRALWCSPRATSWSRPPPPDPAGTERKGLTTPSSNFEPSRDGRVVRRTPGKRVPSRDPGFKSLSRRGTFRLGPTDKRGPDPTNSGRSGRRVGQQRGGQTSSTNVGLSLIRYRPHAVHCSTMYVTSVPCSSSAAVTPRHSCSHSDIVATDVSPVVTFPRRPPPRHRPRCVGRVQFDRVARPVRQNSSTTGIPIVPKSVMASSFPEMSSSPTRSDTTRAGSSDPLSTIRKISS